MQAILRLLLVMALLFGCGAAFAKGAEEPKEQPAVEEPEVEMSMYREAPMLTDMVAAGEIPPVEQRIPEEPLIEAPLEKIGIYGGTLNVFATDPNPWNDLQWGAGLSDGLFRMDRDATGPLPNLATGFDMSDDYKTFTFYLRRGVKWSDGEPLTSEDCVFWYEVLLRDGQLKSWSTLGGDILEEAVALDDYTVQLNWSIPKPDVPSHMAQWPSWLMFQPKHYIQKWHPDFNPDAETLAKEEGFETWQGAMVYHYDWAPQKDLDLPKINPWIMKETTTSYHLFERNPYYWKVDTEGNQYPYIDRVQIQIVDSEVYNLKVISGEADYAYISASFENYTLYKENEEAGDYRVILLPSGDAGYVVALNMTYPDPGIRKIFQDVRFRRALSVAIDRREINNVIYYGQGTPRQATVMPSVSYYKEQWGSAWAGYDRAMANKLLDEMDLTEKDRDGYRLGPDGAPILIVINHDGGETDNNILELITEFWDAVGIKAMVKFLERSLFREQEGTNVHMARSGIMPWADEITNYAQGARGFTGHGDHINYCQLWDRWADTKEAIEDLNEKIAAETDAEALAKLKEDLQVQEVDHEQAVKDLEGEEPPQGYLNTREWFEARQQAAIGSPEYIELSQNIFDFHADQVYLIGTVGMIPKPLIVKNNIGNVIDSSYVSRGVLPLGTTDYYYQMYFK